MKPVKEMTPKELRIAAADIMGFETWNERPVVLGIGPRTHYPPSKCEYEKAHRWVLNGDWENGIHVSEWRPDKDRNQSRQVVEAAAKLLNASGVGAWWIDSDLIALIGNRDHPSPVWRIATPRQEVMAAINAVRAQGGTVNGS